MLAVVTALVAADLGFMPSGFDLCIPMADPVYTSEVAIWSTIDKIGDDAAKRFGTGSVWTPFPSTSHPYFANGRRIDGRVLLGLGVPKPWIIQELSQYKLWPIVHVRRSLMGYMVG